MVEVDIGDKQMVLPEVDMVDTVGKVVAGKRFEGMVGVRFDLVVVVLYLPRSSVQ